MSKILLGLRNRHLGASKLWADENGGPLVEFTVLSPLFFLLLFGIIEWGFIFYLQNNMVNAAREAARSVAVQGLTTAQAQTIAANYLAGNGQTFTYSITDGCNSSPKVQDITVLISVNEAAASLFNYLNMFTGGTIRATVTMRKEVACS